MNKLAVFASMFNFQASRVSVFRKSENLRKKIYGKKKPPKLSGVSGKD
jgi:hypothetical protein